MNKTGTNIVAFGQKGKWAEEKSVNSRKRREPTKVLARADTMLLLSLGADMRRREFIAGLGVAAAWPLSAQAQKIPTIGILSSVSAGPFAAEIAGFKGGLAESGFIEGQNVSLEYRWADNNLDRLPSMASELVNRNITVLVAVGGAPSALAAKAATSSIPILFAGAGDPVRLGLVASLNRPGGNVTGVSFVAVELIGKRLELLRELLPSASAIALVSAGRDPDELQLAESASDKLGLRLSVVRADASDNLQTIFSEIAKNGSDAALIGTSPIFVNRRAEFVAVTAQNRIPAIYARREYVADGGLISYAPPVTDAYRQVGVYAARILRGDKPVDLPVMQPTKFELAINLRTARALGLTILPTLLARADEVIE